MNPSGYQSGWAGVVFCRGGTTVSGINFGPGSPANELRFTWNNNQFSVGTGLIVPPNQWSFFALVVTPTGGTVYLGTNGVLNSVTEPATLTSSAFDAPLLLGEDPSSGGRYYAGALDEIAVFNQSLSPTQIQQLYSNVLISPASLEVSPGSYDFGTIATGTTAQASFVVTNSGGIAVSNGTATVDGGPFAIVSGASFSVPGLGSTNVVVQFAPVSAGGFTNSVVFTTANGGNSTNTVSGAGAVAPVASFTAAPTNGVAPLAVTIIDTSTGSITNRFWNFGDGGTTNVTTNSVVYTYITPGVYTVTEIVTGPGGSGTDTQPDYITVLTPFQAWQIQYFGSTNNPNAAPGVDYTGDGMSNTNEFLAGFDPTNTAAYLQIISIVATNTTDITVIYLGASGNTNYVPGIQSRTNVLDFTTGDASGNYTNGSWQDTGQTNILGVGLTYDGSGGTGLGTVTNMTDVGGAANGPSRYYRVRVLLP